MKTRNHFFLYIVLLIVGILVISNKKSLAGLDLEDTSVNTSAISEKTPGIIIIPESVFATPLPPLGIPMITEVIKQVKQYTEEKVKLDVPYFSQQYANSCEAASLRMALAYYDIEVNDDMDIVQRFGYNPREKLVDLDEWDDPQKMFVGDVNLEGSTEGYGVYGQQVVKAAVSYGREAVYTTNITPQFLAEQLKAGYPVILWGYTSLTEEPYTWNLADGGSVKAFKGEHARLVVGFSGDVENPSGFYVHDPANSEEYGYWNAEDLMNQVNAVPGVTNQAVVVK